MRVWFVVLLMLSASTAIGAESQWHWIKASNNVVKGWTVSEGNADVSIQGDKFEAKLFWKDSTKDVQIVLKGAVKNGKITVNEDVQESDHSGSTYHGAIQIKKWDEFSGTIGAESITPTDVWGMIGITRAIPK
jgi:outer membrane biogenesis lipoprotein LolB